MFQVHKKGFVPGRKMVDGLVPYDFFCEDSPAINLFVFTGAATPDATVQEQTLWGFTRLERFEAMTHALVGNKQQAGWFQSVSVLTGPNQNGTQSVKFQRVLKIIKHANNTRNVDYEILTDEGDTYFTRQSVTADSAQTVIYSAV
ncbi:hypothetical protein IQK56_21205 [Pseudomonas sp. MAFF 301449]|jgi:hypothetical protein|uniref:Uncharacterized protein n=1 Tax=Pseudomonas cyclaminis TaxID=2781239 RepID=A0ABR9SWD6_9PSED|nr:hypothetical protein [Pseudomonas cyclaminis]RMT95854.1 hypothetical protein ALP39_200164 [Pseudomonas marginalis pv. marginalis]VVN11414.1 hypothetical protein PS664_03822 [Pseudomonas fluorescens]MBE8593231.1 hypothetical protein [Pseudomonas cyclaminis]MBE8598429.1 hypothetical protein [Pseudomonas cyclaminis]VVN59653.1 hypothetical protein PS687_03454 [Pseudomonas fluorescens]